MSLENTNKPLKIYKLDSQNDLEVRRYQSASWLTKEGVRLKSKLIYNKGLPDFTDWRFITLTVDPYLYDSPLEAYLYGKSWMRNFVQALGKLLGLPKGFKWAWKLEFQSNGYPHWHMVLECKRRFTHDELSSVNSLWKMGRTEVQRIKGKTLDYLFKYVFKGIYQDDQQDDTEASFAPDWFLDYLETLPTGKVVSFAKVRFWQTSRHFYTGETPEVSFEEAQSCVLARSAREVHSERMSKVQTLARGVDGNYLSSAIITLNCKAREFFNTLGPAVIKGHAVPFIGRSYMIKGHLIENKITNNHITKCQLQRIQKKNSLSVKRRKLQLSSPF